MVTGMRERLSEWNGRYEGVDSSTASEDDDDDLEVSDMLCLCAYAVTYVVLVCMTEVRITF